MAYCQGLLNNNLVDCGSGFKAMIYLEMMTLIGNGYGLNCL